MEKDYEILPYIGVGPLRFGMSSNDVAKLIGTAEDIDKSSFQDEAEESRFASALQLAFSPSDQLVEIQIFSAISDSAFSSVHYKGRHLFKEPGKDIHDFLISEDGAPLETVGIVLLPKLGITFGASGFIVDDIDDTGAKSLTVFVKGRWDGDEDFKPYTTPIDPDN